MTSNHENGNSLELDNWKTNNLESQNENGYANIEDDNSDSDSDSESDDAQGHQALLRTSHEQTRTRGPERIPESLWDRIRTIVIEAAPTLLFTTIGLLFTGELLDQVSHWRAMVQVDQLIIIIPVVLNLKGNLEMNLSARLGTAANMGELDDPVVRKKMIIGSLTLLQLQAAAVSFIAACVALLLGVIIPPSNPSQSEGSLTAMAAEAPLMFMFSARRPRPALPQTGQERDSGFATFLMLASTSMSAACLSGLFLGSFMCFLIVLCRRYGRDPDNIAPPIASCLGDLVTLCLIGIVSKVLINFLHTPLVNLLVCLLVTGTAIVCGMATRRNPYVKDLIFQGWSPLFGAMAISSATGIVLDLFVTRYEGFALLAVVISGLPGSVGAIFVSRLSTALHAISSRVKDQSMVSDLEANPKLVMATLMIITLPVEIIFLLVLHALGWLQLPFLFVAFSVLFFCCAVSSSLFIARWLTNFLWRRGCDPDLYVLPIHSALMDLIGQLLLVLCFEIVSLMGAKVRLKGGGSA